MNKKQKTVIFICVILLILAFIFPPRRHVGYDDSPFVFFLAAESYRDGVDISFAKLFIEFVIIILIGLLLVLFVFNNSKKQKRLPNEKSKGDDIDEPKDKQIKDIPPFFMALGMGQECDQLPNAYGEFGYEPTNPIPVNGPVGETVYINRLRSKTGVGFLYHRIESIKTPISEKPFDKFELVSVDATQRVILYFDLYHPRRTTKCPKSLSLAPWSKMTQEKQLMCKVNGMGITSNSVPQFPQDLPSYIEKSPELASISADLPKAMSRKVREILDKHIDNWPSQAG